MTDLSGYRVVYGRAYDKLDNAVVVRDPTSTSVTIERLAPGTWYFAVIATTSGGRESRRSTVVSKTIA